MLGYYARLCAFQTTKKLLILISNYKQVSQFLMIIAIVVKGSIIAFLLCE